jgi:hypothetical protein
VHERVDDLVIALAMGVPAHILAACSGGDGGAEQLAGRGPLV